MQFCKKCGSLMMPRKNEFVCGCGYKEESTGSTKLHETTTKKTQDVNVVEHSFETNPKTTIVCPKCGNNEAYYWLKQTRSGDEGETQFFKCTKCKHQWRSYR